MFSTAVAPDCYVLNDAGSPVVLYVHPSHRPTVHAEMPVVP